MVVLGIFSFSAISVITGTLLDSSTQYRFATSANLPGQGWSSIICNEVLNVNLISQVYLCGVCSHCRRHCHSCLLVLGKKVTHISVITPICCLSSSLSSLYQQRSSCSSSISDCEALRERSGKGDQSLELQVVSKRILVRYQRLLHQTFQTHFRSIVRTGNQFLFL